MTGHGSAVENVAVHNDGFRLIFLDEFNEGAMGCGRMPRPIVRIAAYNDNAIVDLQGDALRVRDRAGFGFAAGRVDLGAQPALKVLAAGVYAALVDFQTPSSRGGADSLNEPYKVRVRYLRDAQSVTYALFRGCPIRGGFSPIWVRPSRPSRTSKTPDARQQEAETRRTDASH